KAGDDLSRENILKQLTQLKDFKAPMLLPGVTMTISPDNYSPFRKVQLMQFDGTRWVPEGEPVGLSAESGTRSRCGTRSARTSRIGIARPARRPRSATSKRRGPDSWCSR